VVVVLALPEGVTVVVVVVSLRGAVGEEVLSIEIQPDSNVDEKITATSL